MKTAEDLLQELELCEVQAPGPSPEIAERVWRDVEARLDTGGPPPPALDDAPLFPEVSGSVALRVIGGILGVLGIVGVAALALDRTSAEPTPAVEPPVPADAAIAEVSPPISPERVQPTPTPTPVDAEPQPATPEPSDADERTPPSIRRPGPHSGSGSKLAPAAEPRPLTDEVALIEAMSRGLKQGAWSRVLELVAEHERDFGDGQFVEERRAAKARAACRAGKMDAGRKAAAAFAERWPSSIHLPTVRQDCGL